MIVTYTLSLRSGGDTIVIPPFTAGDDEKLLKHIRSHCEQHYNSLRSFQHDYLKKPEELVILMIHH